MKRRLRAKTAALAASHPADRPPTPLEADVTRAIDQELAWYFGYAEAAARLGSLVLLPTYVAVEAAASGASEAEHLRRAHGLVATVQLAVRAVPPRAAGVLRAVYTPRRWPLAVEREFGSLSAIVVRLSCADNPWPERSSHDGLEHAAALYLARQLAREDARPGALRKEARRLMGAAITAYVRARSQPRTVTP